jgi:hypothetical protein
LIALKNKLGFALGLERIVTILERQRIPPMKLSTTPLPVDSHPKSHPLLTVLLFGAIILGLVAFGSYFSKQRSTARDAGDTLAPIISLTTPAKR